MKFQCSANGLWIKSIRFTLSVFSFHFSSLNKSIYTMHNICSKLFTFNDDVDVLGFYVPPTAKVIRRRILGLKSHPKDCFRFKFAHIVQCWANSNCNDETRD